MPERIQRKRSKDWRMPENTAYVGRPTKWGNPYSVSKGENGMSSGARETLVRDFEYWLNHPHDRYERPGKFKAPGFATCAESRAARDALLASLPELRGKNLACWCPPGQACHADVLLRIANTTCTGIAAGSASSALSASESSPVSSVGSPALR